MRLFWGQSGKTVSHPVWVITRS